MFSLNLLKQKLLLEVMSSVLEGERPKVAKVVWVRFSTLATLSLSGPKVAKVVWVRFSTLANLRLCRP